MSPELVRVQHHADGGDLRRILAERLEVVGGHVPGFAVPLLTPVARVPHHHHAESVAHMAGKGRADRLGPTPRVEQHPRSGEQPAAPEHHEDASRRVVPVRIPQVHAGQMSGDAPGPGQSSSHAGDGVFQVEPALPGNCVALQGEHRPSVFHEHLRHGLTPAAHRAELPAGRQAGVGRSLVQTVQAHGVDRHGRRTNRQPESQQ